jgi:NAD(P)-dependent dehydrogenase (short-subunit alcohol dehydrogenase family)
MDKHYALVWGAEGGIGSSIVARLNAENWGVVGFSRRAETAPREGYAIEADAADAFSVQRAVLAAGQEIDPAQLFVYAVGDIHSAPVAATAPDAWRRVLDANLTGAYLALSESLSLLTPEAPLVFIGAVSERLRLPGLGAYAAAKAGLEAFVEVVRKEQRHRPVLLVRPGAVRTDFWEKVPFRMPPNALSPEEVAARIMTAVNDRTTGTLDL